MGGTRGGTDWGDKGGGGIDGEVSGGNLQAFSFLGRSRRGFFFRPKTRFWISGKSFDFYKLLVVLGAPAGAFFSPKNPFLDFWKIL